MPDNERLTMTIGECAERLGISRNLAYGLAKRGELPGVIRLGKRLVISRRQIEKLLNGDDRKTQLLASSSTEG